MSTNRGIGIRAANTRATGLAFDDALAPSPERDPGALDAFDPAAEGSRYGLARELSATSAQNDQRSQRLQSFIDFVVQRRIPPTITTYAEKAWTDGKHGEFFAEAYALWLSDPHFLRRNFQPLYLYFQQGLHRA